MKKIILISLLLLFIPVAVWGQSGTCRDSDGNLIYPPCGGDELYDADDRATVKFAKIATDGADADDIVSAVASKKIKVLGYLVACSAATDITFEDGDGTDISGTINLVANGNLTAVAPVNPLGWFETPTANKSLALLKSAAVDCDGHLTYIEVD